MSNKQIENKTPLIIAIAVSALLIVLSFVGRYFDGALKSIAGFFVGCFGMSLYGLLAGVIVVCALLLAGKKINVPAKYIANFAVMYFVVILLVHTFTTLFFANLPFNEYSAICFDYYNTANGVPTFGGVIFGAVSYALQHTITVWGSCVLLFLTLALTVYFAGDYFYKYVTGQIQLEHIRNSTKEDVVNVDVEQETVSDGFGTTARASTERDEAMEILFGNHPIEETTQPAETDNTVDAMNILYGNNNVITQPESSQPISPSQLFEDPNQPPKPTNNGFFGDDDDFIVSRPVATPTVTPVNIKPEPDDVVDGGWIEPDVKPTTVDVTDVTVEGNNFTNEPEDVIPDENTDEDEIEEEITDELNDDGYEYTTYNVKNGNNVTTKIDVVKVDKTDVVRHTDYVFPDTSLLCDAEIVQDLDEGNRKRSIDAIVRKLAAFNIKVEPVDPIVGPTVTKYMFKVLSERTRMSDFAQFSLDLTSCLESECEVRIEAPVRGTNLVGIEVPNKNKTLVRLRTILESNEFKNAKGSLVFSVGQEVDGHIVVADLASLPHLLVAGATRMGKSVWLHSMILSIMYKYSPEYVRFIMVDPKFELSCYNGCPHMLTKEAIAKVEEALSGMDYLINEMQSRYELFKQARVANIEEYNTYINKNTTQPLPYLVLIVDELNDLMTINKKEIENKIMRLAQKARAAGIHLVIATQRPSVDVITGTIKANLPSRIAFKVSSFADSKTILDCGGAEKLLGNGDMLFVEPSSKDAVRIQGPFISKEEKDAVTKFITNNNECYFDQKASDKIFVKEVQPEDDDDIATKKDVDPLCKKVLKFWITSNKRNASISTIVRYFSVGFTRAGKIFATIDSLGCLEPMAEGEQSSKPRRVLDSITEDKIDELFPDLDD